MAALLSHLHRQRRRILAGLIGMLILAPVIILYSGNYFARDPIVRFPAQGRPAPILVLSFSGDMGLRYGMGGVIARALSASGIAVTGINSPVLFRTKRSQAEIDAIVADCVRRAAMEAVLSSQPPASSSVTMFTLFSPHSSKPRPSGQPGQLYQVSPAR